MNPPDWSRLPPPPLPSARAASLQSERWSTSLVELLGWLGLAVVAPLCQRLAHRPVFLYEHDWPAVVVFVATVALLVPGIVIAVAWGVGAPLQRVRQSLMTVAVWLLAGLFALLVLNHLDGHWYVAWPLAPLLATGSCWLRSKASWFRQMIRLCAWGAAFYPLVLLLVFANRPKPQVVDAEFGRARLEARHPTPVLFLVFDEFCGMSLLNADREIDADRYPNFAALASTSTWYRNASSVHARTMSAVPALLTGNRPRVECPPTVEHYPQNLFTVLHRTEGFDVRATEFVTELDPVPRAERRRERLEPTEQIWSLLTTLPVVYLRDLFPDLEPFPLPEIPNRWYGVPTPRELLQEGRRARIPWGNERTEQVATVINSITPINDPTLFFGHVILPHAPYRYLPTGEEYRSDRTIMRNAAEPARQVPDIQVSEVWSGDEWDVTHFQQRYLLQVGFSDSVLGEVLGRLQAVQLFDDALIIVTADHGVSFRQGRSKRQPPREFVADTMSVPLFIKYPGQQWGEVSDRNVESIDLFPTILDVLGISGIECEGRSVLEQGERATKVFNDGTRTYTLDAAFEEKYLTWQDYLGRFGTGRDPLNLYRIGPRRNLVGKRVDELRVGAPLALKMDLQGANVEPIPSVLQPAAMLVGRFRRGEWRTSPEEYAVAVNGQIVATTRRFGCMPDCWAAMIPIEQLSPPKEESLLPQSPVDEASLTSAQTTRPSISVYAITQGAQELELRLCLPSDDLR